MSNSRQPVRILVAACAMLACSTAAKADAADFYSGKTVTMLVGVPPGGTPTSKVTVLPL